MGLFNRLTAGLLPSVPRPLVGYFARPYIAGEHLSDAVRTVQQLMAEGACATVDVLGEEVTSARQAGAAVEAYLEALAAIAAEGLDANISLKPTQMGLKIDEDLCYRNIEALVEHAARSGTFVRIDMEDHSCTDATLRIYRRLRQQHSNVGTVLQAQLHRTLDDLDALLPLMPNLRICKGIYLEPQELASRDPSMVRGSFVRVTDTLLERGCYVGIATHDAQLVNEAEQTVDRLGLSRDRYEFQMLLGVEPRLRRLLLARGHRLRVYVPFGPDWLAYGLRRLRENPTLVGHILRQTLRRLRGS